MLSNTPDVEDKTPSDTMHPGLKSPEEAAMEEFLEQLVSPEFRDAASFEEFLTSPLLSTPYDPSLDDFSISPNDDSPFADFLTTPLIQDDSEPLIGTGDVDLNLLYGSMPLFGGLQALTEETVAPKDVSPKLFDTDKMHLNTPSTPALDSLSINPASVYPSPQINMTSFAQIAKPTSLASSSAPTTVTTSLAARRSAPTGTRKNITASSLVPLDAPTQSRKYVAPSATSRKEVPAVFERKRKRTQAQFDLDGEDQLDNEEPLPPNATEREQIEWKRRQNTLAARKSRKRKLEHQQYLENRLETLERDVEIWRTRTQTLQSILKSHGIPVAEFPEGQ